MSRVGTRRKIYAITRSANFGKNDSNKMNEIIDLVGSAQNLWVLCASLLAVVLHMMVTRRLFNKLDDE